jgi:hypothetical protein
MADGHPARRARFFRGGNPRRRGSWPLFSSAAGDDPEAIVLDKRPRTNRARRSQLRARVNRRDLRGLGRRLGSKPLDAKRERVPGGRRPGQSAFAALRGAFETISDFGFVLFRILFKVEKAC